MGQPKGSQILSFSWQNVPYINLYPIQISGKLACRAEEDGLVVLIGGYKENYLDVMGTTGL